MDEENWDEDWDEEIVSSSVKKPVFNKPHNQPSSNFAFGRGRVLEQSRERESNYSNCTSRSQSSRGESRYNRDGNYSNRNRYENSSSGFGSNHTSSFSKSSNRYDDNNNYRNYDLTEFINIDPRSISMLIGKGGSTINNIRQECSVKIDIPPREEIQNLSKVDIKIMGASYTNIDRAKRMISETIQRPMTYGQPRTDSIKHAFSENSKRQHSEDNLYDQNRENLRCNENKRAFNFNSQKDSNQNESTSFIDWDKVRSQPLQDLTKFKDQPEIMKDFYIEDEEVAAMTRDEVKAFRIKNFNITIELFKKEKLSYSLNAKVEEDTRTEQEIEDHLFKIIPNPVRTIEQCFKNFPGIMEECKRQNFINPTPIQSQLWPILLKGVDCVGIAQTGTGKTLAFLLPALIHIDNQITPREKRHGPNVLVLSPTRELAIQIEQEVKKINYKGIRSLCVYGGGDRKEQMANCERGVEIIIATPGRLYDLIQAGAINVTSVTYLVLDEADRMLDLGFEPQIMKILLDIRPDRQTVMTSATWPEGVRRLATKYLNEPIQLYVGSLDLNAAKTVTQHLIMVRSDDEKRENLMDYIENKMKPTDKLIVFVGRKSLADNLSCDLCMKQITVQSIHGDREQVDREEALEDFREGRVRILIATDVASRGIDVKDITCVINYDFPRNIEDYVHRVGRTGRAGLSGTAITYMAREDWKHSKELIEILNKGEQEVPESLIEMSQRYDAMLKRREEEGGRGGRGGRGGFRHNDRNRSENSGFRSFDSRGGGRGRRDDSGGFILM